MAAAMRTLIIRRVLQTLLLLGFAPVSWGSIRVSVFNSTTAAGAVISDTTVDTVGLDVLPSTGPFTAVFLGELTAQIGTYYKFGMQADVGWVRLWVDDHPMIDGGMAEATSYLEGHGAGSQHIAAKYAIPVPFFPGASASRIRLELTVGPGQAVTRLALLTNGTAVPADALRPDFPTSEVRYFQERAAAEVGWNTWLSEDMLTHALLPHGLALSMSFRAGEDVLSGLGARGVACDRKVFPATHGLHDTRGEYTEIQSLDFAGASFRVESAVVDGNLLLLVTTLAGSSLSEDVELHVDASVPPTWKPRHCEVQGGGPTLLALCPGFQSVALRPCKGAPAQPTPHGFSVRLMASKGDSVAFMTGDGPLQTVADVAAAIGAARAKLLNRIGRFANHSDAYAGMATAIAWNVVYTPLEGIVTPVFRGSPWSVAKPKSYVLFEWDTYLAAMIAAHVDEWVAKSNIIRMSKSLIYKGYVAGFWNGVCGEVDKSKPPVGGLALQYLVERAPRDNLWVADLVVESLVMWNRWWVQARLKRGMIAPGSTRGMVQDPLFCASVDKSSATSASRCETGLDNSPLYTGAGYEAKFIDSENVIDSADVGMTALYAHDCIALASLARSLGRSKYEAELSQRGAALQRALNLQMWNEQEGVYLNKMWQTDDWIPRSKTGSPIVAPTNFYPMLSRTPSDAQVDRMLQRWLTNASEFCVSSACKYGLPSISRSSSAFADNNYWRGRAWGPMNWLVYLGLRQYSHLEHAAAARRALAEQSEATFLVEWVRNHRVMENYNSEKGVGCDVKNAVPFYHWGALNALIPLLEAGLLGQTPSRGEQVVIL